MISGKYLSSREMQLHTVYSSDNAERRPSESSLMEEQSDWIASMIDRVLMCKAV